MKEWKHKICLNKAIEANNEEFDLSRFEDDAPEVAKDRIAAELSKAQPLAHFAPLVRAAKSVAELNRLLNRIYDRADECSVWCGGM